MTTRGNETLDFPGMDLSHVLRTAAGKTRRVRSADALQTSGQLIPAAGDVGTNEANRIPVTVRREPLQVPRAADIGPLQAEAGEKMMLHTRDALQLFLGRAAAAGQPAIAGGRRYAAAMRVLWVLSSTDNPFADWILIRAEDQLRMACAQMAQGVLSHEDRLQRLVEQGLSFGRLASTQPVGVALGFTSPYGYATARAVVEFDRYVRVVRALVLRDLMSDEQGRQAVRDAGRILRALFLEPIRWERVLMRADLRRLSRSDFDPDAGHEARCRVSTAQALLGQLPAEVLGGVVGPRHSRRVVAGRPARLQGAVEQPKGLDSGVRSLTHPPESVTPGPIGLPESLDQVDPVPSRTADDSPECLDVAGPPKPWVNTAHKALVLSMA